jgi:hypothetical protein
VKGGDYDRLASYFHLAELTKAKDERNRPPQVPHVTRQQAERHPDEMEKIFNSSCVVIVDNDDADEKDEFELAADSMEEDRRMLRAAFEMPLTKEVHAFSESHSVSCQSFF